MFANVRKYRPYRSCGWGGSFIVTASGLLAAAGCGPFWRNEATDGTPRTTLGSTVTDSESNQDPVGPASTDGDAAGPELRFAAKPVFCCNTLSIDFVADLAGVSTDGVTFEWDFGDGRTATGAAVQHTFATRGDYAVELTARIPVWGVHKVRRTLSLGASGDDNIVTPPKEGVSVEPAVEDGVDDGDGGDGPGDAPIPDDLPASGDDVVTAPVANAGIDQTADAGQTVRLDGTASVYETSPAPTFTWLELSGVGVDLRSDATLTPTFVAPAPTTTALELTFELRVSVGDMSDSATVRVTVQPVLESLGDPINRGDPVEFFSGPQGDAAPGTMEVTWRFNDGLARSNVRLEQDCCECAEITSAPIRPDARGVYRATVSVPSDGTIWYSVLYNSDEVDHRSQSIYVNPAEGDNGAEPPPVIWSHNRGRNPAILHEVVRSGVVTHVVIRGGDRVAFAHDDPIVLEEVDICRSAGLKIIWGRHLWNNWEDFQTREDAFDPDFYASAVAQVHAEAAALGADFTYMDCEVYGNSPLDDYLDSDLDPESFEAMGAAILEAADLAQVDFVSPSGAHGSSMHPNNLYRPLGRIRIAKSTYWDVPSKNCRITYPFEVFAAYVQPGTERPSKGLAPYFLPQDILQRRYHWSQADGALGFVNGLFLYPGSVASQDDTIMETATMLADFFESQ